MSNPRTAKGLPDLPFEKLLPPGFDVAEVFRFFEGDGQGRDNAGANARDFIEFRAPQASEPSDFDAVNDSADAKPAHAGGGKSSDTTDTTDGGGGKGGGKGKNKDEGTTDGGTTDGGTTDGGATDGGATDGGATDGGTTGGGTTDGGTEVNPGSNDPAYYVAGMDDPEGYNVTVHFNGSWSTAARQGVINAAEFISEIITTDIVSHNGIDDVLIQAYSQAIDGTGGVLAQGGWISHRGDPMMMVSEGGIRVDSADVSGMLGNGTFEDAVFHEMLHAIGFGTTWDYTGLTATIGGGQRFTGQNAIDVYNAEYASAANDPYSVDGVPLDGSGSHWKQTLFGDEVMSPQLGTNEHVSNMTIAALEDMGYETIYGDAALA